MFASRREKIYKNLWLFSFILAQAIAVSVSAPVFSQEKPVASKEIKEEKIQPETENQSEEKQEGVTQDLEKYPNKSLIQSAWDNFNEKEFDAALSYAERCIALYDKAAKKQQASLKASIPKDRINQYWTLNDVATAKFIKGKILWIRDKDKVAAKEIFSDIAVNYKYAMCYDLSGWYWSVSRASEDMLKAIDLGIDFGNSSSSFLTTEAWNAYNKKDYQAALGFAEQCVKMYKDAAMWQQKSLNKYPAQDKIKQYWALNDVGTCCYIAGKCLLKLNQREKAREYFSFVRNKLPFASCWDTRGWYWKVVDAL